MARNRYIRTNSNYILKGMHQSTNVGNIYERNWMTIDSLNSYSPGTTFYSGSNGFKMLPSNTIDLKKRHQFGFWLKNENSEYWSENSMDIQKDASNDSNQLISKPNYASMLDFAYYGSAVKMVESSLRKIINNFPGEAFLTDNCVIIDGVRRYYVDNPFDIDFESFIIGEDKNAISLRMFSKSYSNYLFYDESKIATPLVWSRRSTNANVCNPNGSLLSIIDLGSINGGDNHLLLYVYNYNGVKTLFHDGSFTNGSIRPNTSKINAFFRSLDDFQSKLLDRKTNYTATFNTPEENEKGYFEIIRSYTWPKRGVGEWNLDISSEIYKKYVEDLLNIATFYDTYFSNNMWSRMTHESIINMDETIVKIDGNMYDKSEFKHGHKIQKFIHIAGRIFDDVKRYIDGVSYSNAFTYNESQNKSDYFLTEELDNYGWDVKLPVFIKNDDYITSPLYPSHVDGYDRVAVNNEFYRRLLLNSAAILSAKGTKRSIEMIMSLFGYRSLNFVEHSFHEVERNGKTKLVTWEELTSEEKNEILRNVYDITEYVYVTDDESLGFLQENVSVVKQINNLKMTYDATNKDEYQGIPVREVIFTKEEEIITKAPNGDDVVIGNEIIENNYLIPWFDKHKEYDGNLYFESEGGWGLTTSKTNHIEGYGDKYYETGEGLKVYDESVKHLKFKETIGDLLNSVNEIFKENDVYYIYDISGAKDYDWGLLGDEAQPTLSHYFILKNESYSRILGVLRDSEGNVMVESGTGVPNTEQFEDSNTELSDNYNAETLPDYPNIKWDELPTKLYGWKNISEEELQANATKDSQRVFYLEGIIDNNIGNNPHSGNGHYDDGETYKTAFEDVFKAAREDYEYEDVDDEILEGGYDENTFKMEDKLFSLNKQIDNVKCWYFTDLSEDSNLVRLEEIERGELVEGGIETSIVGNTESFVRHYYNKEYEDIYNSENLMEFDKIFDSKQYPIMLPVNPEGGSTDDEAAANSIVNTKSLYIEFMPDYKSAKSMYEFIEDIVMHYAKQVIPSTTLLKYKIPMTGLESFCYKRTYSQSALL